MLMRAALRHARIAHELSVAGDGTEALDILYRRNGNEQAPTVDLALFDINLPGMSGIELLEKVKNDSKLKTTQVIMLSSSDAPKDIQQSYEHHANCYLTKPSDMSELTDTVRAIDNFWLSLVHLPNNA